MVQRRFSLISVFAVLAIASTAPAQTITTQTDLLVIPKGSIVGLQVTCTGCDEAGIDDVVSATVDDTNYATVDPSSQNVAGDPFVSIFNIKGENQGGTILRISYAQNGGPAITQKSVTIQVIEDIDDDCIFDDLTAGDGDRDGLLLTLRRYRNEVLDASARGRRYTKLYYEHSPEMIQILSADAGLRDDLLMLARKHQTALESILAGQAFKLSQQEVAAVDGVLARLQTQSSPALSRTLTQLRGDLRDKSSMRSFGAGIRR